MTRDEAKDVWAHLNIIHRRYRAIIQKLRDVLDRLIQGLYQGVTFSEKFTQFSLVMFFSRAKIAAKCLESSSTTFAPEGDLDIVIRDGASALAPPISISSDYAPTEAPLPKRRHPN